MFDRRLGHRFLCHRASIYPSPCTRLPIGRPTQIIIVITFPRDSWPFVAAPDYALPRLPGSSPRGFLSGCVILVAVVVLRRRSPSPVPVRVSAPSRCAASPHPWLLSAPPLLRPWPPRRPHTATPSLAAALSPGAAPSPAATPPAGCRRVVYAPPPPCHPLRRGRHQHAHRLHQRERRRHRRFHHHQGQ